MVSKPDKAILEYKKAFFLKEVGKAAKLLGAPIPKVKFWSHYKGHFNKNERAHIHISENLICIAEPELAMMSEEDIKETTTHEVSHLNHIDHGWDFHKTQADLGIGGWPPPTGTTGALPEGYKSRKNKEKKISSSICNYHSCNKRRNLHKCKHCGGYFCLEHKKPQLAGMPKFGSDKFEDLEFLEKTYRESKGHPCVPYYDYWKKKREKEDEEYSKALDRLSIRKNRDFKIVSPNINYQESDDSLDLNEREVYKTEKYPLKKSKRKKVKKLIIFTLILILLGLSFYLWYTGKLNNWISSIFEDNSLPTYDQLYSNFLYNLHINKEDLALFVGVIIVVAFVILMYKLGVIFIPIGF